MNILSMKWHEEYKYTMAGKTKSYKIWNFHGCGDLGCGPLGYDPVYSDKWLTIFQRNLLTPSQMITLLDHIMKQLNPFHTLTPYFSISSVMVLVLLCLGLQVISFRLKFCDIAVIHGNNDNVLKREVQRLRNLDWMCSCDDGDAAMTTGVWWWLFGVVHLRV